MFQIVQPRTIAQDYLAHRLEQPGIEPVDDLLYLSYLLNYRHPSLHQEYHDSAQWQHS